MKNLKAHDTLKTHIEVLKKLTNENEILKHIIKTLKNENYKLSQSISTKNNKEFIQNFNLNNNNEIIENINSNNNNEIEKKYKNNVVNFLNRYNIGNNKINLEKNNNKIEVPKLLVILYKKNLINQ